MTYSLTLSLHTLGRGVAFEYKLQIYKFIPKPHGLGAIPPRHHTLSYHTHRVRRKKVQEDVKMYFHKNVFPSYKMTKLCLQIYPLGTKPYGCHTPQVPHPMVSQPLGIEGECL